MKIFYKLNFSKVFLAICLLLMCTIVIDGCEDDPLLEDDSSSKKNTGSYAKINPDVNKESDDENNGKYSVDENEEIF